MEATIDDGRRAPGLAPEAMAVLEVAEEMCRRVRAHVKRGDDASAIRLLVRAAYDIGAALHMVEW
jgi:hypothetical protein